MHPFLMFMLGKPDLLLLHFHCFKLERCCPVCEETFAWLLAKAAMFCAWSDKNAVAF
jgi:hypothetical protein